MDEQYNWGAEENRAPTLLDGDVLLYSECGRIIKRSHGHHDGIDYRSHYFRIVKARYGGAYLLVKHGGGEERISLGYTVGAHLPFLFEPLDSNARYLLMHLLFNIHKDAERAARHDTAQTYRDAFAQGRLKKRKQRGQNNIKV